MDLEKLKKFTALHAIPDQLLYSLLIWPDHSIPASYGPGLTPVLMVGEHPRECAPSTPTKLSKSQE